MHFPQMDRELGKQPPADAATLKVGIDVEESATNTIWLRSFNFPRNGSWLNDPWHTVPAIVQLLRLNNKLKVNH